MLSVGIATLIWGWPGPTELLIILVIILVIFGGRKVPEVAKSLGKGIRAFKQEAEQMRREIKLEAESEPQETEETERTGKEREEEIEELEVEAESKK